jgi:DNA-binding XRE family transcriptional regulator
MPPVPTAKPDGAKIGELIRERGYTVTDFARKIGRHRQAIWNITGYAPDTSITFLRQIARELGVSLSDISDAGDDEPETTNPRRWAAGDDTGSEPEPKVPAA